MDLARVPLAILYLKELNKTCILREALLSHSIQEQK
jgi:hypothetical protein